ncbi:MAG: tetratricopeptide repeat protein, partial [Patescibacteria group bacterium]|nr:tetratricopeptide repeat protein [Patescibacteria group bacterium]
ENDSAKALDYDKKALAIAKELNDKLEEATLLSAIGNVYGMNDNDLKALEYDTLALNISRQTGDVQEQTDNYTGITIVYYHRHNYAEALDYANKTLELAQKIGDKMHEANSLGLIGKIYLTTGRFKEAEPNLKKAIELDSAIQSNLDEQNWELSISELYDTTARYRQAFIWYKKAMTLKDTLFNMDKDKALTRKELTFKFERQADSAKAAQDKKDAVAASDKKKQDVITASVSMGLMLVLAFSVLLFNRFRITQRQKVLIEQQKNVVEKQKEEVEKKNVVIESQKRLVEEKNKDILDSITYAKRLQDAILPPVSLVQKYFPESFVLYKPKDIVAGDFYWLERAGDTILLAAADCTGHGVPGALVSVVCSNALNRAVKEFHITEPGKILDKVRELVLETFEKSEGNIQDGMDISLLAISGINSPSLSWSGAYNPLWVASNGKISELEGDKQPIGKTDNPKPFTTHTLTLNPLSGGRGAVYLFTDGFADQ